MSNPRIFIVENDITPIKLIHWDYEQVFNLLNTAGSVYPPIPKPISDDAPEEFNQMTNLFKDLAFKEEAEKKDVFEKIYEKFAPTNFYVIDKELITKAGDSFGIEFFKFLLEEKDVRKNQCFFISDYDPDTFNISINKFFFEDKKVADFENRLLNKIKQIWKAT